MKEERVPPQNIEAEQSVLGGVLLDNYAFDAVSEILIPEDFYNQNHGKIFHAILDLANKNLPVDIITLTEELNKNNTIDSIGGSSYLAYLLDSVVTTANIKHYAEIVKSKSILRKTIQSATTIVAKCYECTEDVDELLNEAEKSIFDIADRDLKKSCVPLKSVIKDSLNKIEKLYENKKSITGIATGYDELDKLTSGLQQSDLIIVASRPSMGKTALSLNIAVNVASREKMPVAIFSLEMSKEQLGLRMLSSEARIDSMRLRTGFLKAEDWPKLAKAAGVLGDAKIFIDDSFGITVPEIRAKARRLKREENISLVIIDYLQLIRVQQKLNSREQEIAYVSRSLKGVAKELNIPVIAISQLSRETEKRENKRPQFSDLRESGSIEQDADIIAFIYRPEYYKKDDELEGIAEVIIAKHRNGPPGDVKLAFLKDFARFENLEI